MTAPTPEQPAQAVVQVNARFCSDRLQQLHAAYPAAKAAAEAAAAALKNVTDGIKRELGEVLPEGSQRADLIGADGPRLSLAYVERWTLDTNRLKAENPLVYASYAKQSGSWRLSVAKATEDGA